MSTSPTGGCGFEHEDGAYVLGALSPEDRVAFERHLATCPECSRSVREMAGIPGLLARVPVEILDPEQEPVPVPETLLPALVRATRRTQRRRAWVTSGLVAAAAAVAIGAVGVASHGDGDDGGSAVPPAPTSSTAPPEPLTPVGAEPISGWVSLTTVGWGTRLDLTCSYSEADGEGNPYRDDAPPLYTMVVTHADGSTEQVASWKGLPGKTMHLAAATSSDVADITDVQVRTDTGETVLELS